MDNDSHDVQNKPMPVLQRERDQLRAEARQLLDRAEDDLTGADAEEFDRITAGIESRNVAIAHLERAAEIARAARDGSRFRIERGDGAAGGDPYGDDSRRDASDYIPRPTSTEGQRLSFDASMAAALTRSIAGDEERTRNPLSTRALAANGAAVVAQGFTPDPVALGRPANSLLSVLPVTQHATSEFAYLRQTVRDNKAAIVSEGSTKPTSTYTVERIPDELDVLAHLSEGIPRFWLNDNATLLQFIQAEMLYGLRTAVEAMALSDIAGTQGVVPNAYDTSLVVTLRKSITALEVGGYDPAALILSPADWEAVELLLSTTNSIEHMSLPFDSATRRLFSVPVVTTNAQAEGTAHTLARGAAGLDTDTLGVGIQWSETSNSDDWSKNLIRCRCEGRYATSVFLPAGVIESDLGTGS